ncbi:phosphatase PAP2 family protein [Acetobacter sp. AN02]|uniref:acid phosphatase n=1 Tax=Acetobacter sp. AN02 TaxID=2894186 RepID=UPI0024345239|nr:phosphatase PAP2 family protein [Acetobacter sp. AN02]MDG6093673.1 phosphatase PAP2 family protein [Acetobacter sp. AN02]
MPVTKHRLLTFGFLLCCCACVSPGTPPADPPSEAPAAGPVLSISPPPAGNSAAAADDMRIFVQTRALQGSERWALARHDADLTTAHLLDDYSCAAGLRLDAADLPLVTDLITHALTVVRAHVSEQKKHWKRLRPAAVTELPVCTDDREKLKLSYSYPSGHASRGWMTAFVLADLLPDQAGPVMERGRIFAQSRVVCGAHWNTDIIAGKKTAAAVFASVRNTPWYKKEAEEARSELATARTRPTPPDPAACTTEHNAARTSW